MNLKVMILASMVMAICMLSSAATADLCYSCGGGSKHGCQQCRSRSGKDTQADRKICKSLGCEVTGYGTCSDAANVKVCQARPSGPLPASEVFPFHGMPR